MRSFSSLAALSASLIAVSACSSESAFIPRPSERTAGSTPLAQVHAGSPAGITLHDESFVAEAIVEGLATPQGIVGRGRGLTFVGIGETGVILRVLPNGLTSEHAQIPLLPGESRRALVHLISTLDGGIYATDLRQDAVFKVDGKGVVSTFASALLAPNQVDYDSQGQIYVSEISGRRVSRLAPDGSRSTVVQLDVSQRPTGIAIDASDNLYIFSGLSGRIWKFALGGAEPAPLSSLELVATVPDRSASNRGDNLTFGPDGDLFAISSLDLYRVRLDGSTALFVSGLNGPFNSVSASTNRDLLVTEFADSTAAGRALRIRPAHRP